MAERARQATPRQRPSLGRTIVEYVVLALIAVGVALIVQAFLVKPYRIPSESMQDTLLVRDRVLVDRISWRFTEPKRGEVVVFNQPGTGLVLIKRLIGMPGDVLSVADGSLFVNGRRQDEPYVRQIDGMTSPTEPLANPEEWNLQRPYTVPAGSYFMMGDNRTDSADSREFGPVKREAMIGSAFARYWPISRIGGL